MVNCLMLLKLQIQHNPGFMFELSKHSYCLSINSNGKAEIIYSKTKVIKKKVFLNYKSSCRELVLSHLKDKCTLNIGLCYGAQQGNCG